MKRLIVCCDGTWNRPDQVVDGVASPTNVAKIALAIADRDATGTVQRLHYEAGVGTRRHERLLGGATGVGLSRNVQDGFRFLIEHYEPGDELYLFGFSRGAFTARSLVGLIRNSGILRCEHRDRVEEAYSLYRNPDRDQRPAGIAAELFRRSYSHDEVFVQFVGVWDTVGALGIPIDGLRLPVLSNRWTFHDTKLSRYVLHAYHALAIDEQRKAFEPTLWERQGDAGDQVLEQRWFAGVHCDVGGGYRDPSLAELPLQWMAEKAQECGLAFKPDHLVLGEPADSDERRTGMTIAPDPMGQIHQSRKSFYKLQPAYDRPLVGTAGGMVAPSAEQRHDADPQYRPPGLVEWLAARVGA